MPLRFPFRALAHRNYRLYFFGQGVSVVGTWMQQLAVGWLVFLLTGAPFWLGVAGFAGQIPSLFLAPAAGVLVDRWNRHRLLLLTQSLAMTQAFTLAYLTGSGGITVAQVIGLSLFLGVVNAFDLTARQAFLTEMIDRREDLPNAIALNSSLVNAARLVGPAVAGVLLAEVGAAVCFLINGLSYLAVLAALLAMRPAARPRSAANPHFLEGLREGVRYTFGFPPVRALLALLAVVSLLGGSYSALLPVFAVNVLHGGPGTMGLLSASAGVGSLSAAVTLAARGSIVGLGRWIALAPAVLAAGLVGLSWSGHVWLSAALLAAIGFALMVHMAATNTLLQTIVAEDLRGRVLSFYTMALIGMTPVGSLLAGVLADAYGAPVAVRLAGLGCLAGSVWFALHLPRLRAVTRPVYVRLGILPPSAVPVPEEKSP
jgi:MFS family permease